MQTYHHRDGQVVLLTTDFKPMNGGVAEYLHQLWDHVARLRQVTVMTPSQSRTEKWEHFYRLDLLPPLPRRLLGSRVGDGITLLRKLNTARYFSDLRRYAKQCLATIRAKVGADAEVFIGIWDTESHFLCWELRKEGIPYTIHAHGLELVSRFYGRLPQWRQDDFQNASAIVANSDATAALAHAEFGKDLVVKVAHPGVAGPDVATLNRRLPKLKRDLSAQNGRRLLTVGRLIQRKGIDLVLKCLFELRHEFSDLQYLIAGDGPERQRLEALTRELHLNDRVRFLGAVDATTKWALYQFCDLFIMPNRLLEGKEWEGFGIVFLEAAFAGKPSIGGNNGGVPEAIENGVTGLLVDPEDPQALTSALRRLLNNEEFRSNMGIAAQLRAREKFSWNAIARTFCEKQHWA